MVEWARLVDGMIVQLAPSLRFNLDGKRALDVLRGRGVPDEAYERPQWTNQGRFVVIYPQGDGTARASFVPPAVEWDDAFTNPAFERQRFYDMDPSGARRVADEIISFLDVGSTPPVPTRVDPRPDAFLSHAWEDSEFCARLASALAARGVTVWYDQSATNGIPAAGFIAGHIDEAMRLCRGGIILATPTYFTRPFCMLEYSALTYRSTDRSEPLIAVVKDMGYRELPPLLASRLNVHERDGLDTIVERLVQVFRPPAPAAVSAAPVATHVPPASASAASTLWLETREAPLDALPADALLPAERPALSLRVVFRSEALQYRIANTGTVAVRDVTLFLPGIRAAGLTQIVAPGSSISVQMRLDGRRNPVRGQAQAIIEFEDLFGNVFRQYADTTPVVKSGVPHSYKVGNVSRPYLVAQRIIAADNEALDDRAASQPDPVTAQPSLQLGEAPSAEPTSHNVAFYVDDGFFVVPVESVRDGEIVTVRAIADNRSLASAIDRLRDAGDQIIGVAFDLKAFAARVVSMRYEFAPEGRRIEIDVGPVEREVPMDLTTRDRSANDIALLRARRILLDEPLPRAAEARGAAMLDAGTLEYIVQSRQSLMPVLRSPLPNLWRVGAGDAPGEFVKNAKLVALLYLRLSNTVESIDRLDMELLDGARLRVHFVGHRAPTAAGAAGERIQVAGELSIAQP